MHRKSLPKVWNHPSQPIPNEFQTMRNSASTSKLPELSIDGFACMHFPLIELTSDLQPFSRFQPPMVSTKSKFCSFNLDTRGNSSGRNIHVRLLPAFDKPVRSLAEAVVRAQAKAKAKAVSQVEAAKIPAAEKERRKASIIRSQKVRKYVDIYIPQVMPFEH